MEESNLNKYRFDDFELDAAAPSLKRNGELVAIAPKALGLLCALVERRGEIVSREELYELVWGDTFVEDANITYTVSLLRKTLGDRELIKTVSKRGYRFVGTLEPPAPDTLEPETDRGLSGGRRWKTAVAVTIVLCIGLAAAIWRTIPGTPISNGDKVQNLAVLPFRNLTKNEEDVSLSLGLADALITKLGGLKRFTVRPLSAVERFAKQKKDPVGFADDLGCDSVLVGTLMNVEDKIAVNARLLHVPDGHQLWAGSFEIGESEFVTLQSEVALRVAASMLKDLSESDRRVLGRRSTENPVAYRAYLRGRTIFERRSEDGFERALDEFQSAVSLDPAFASAYAGLANLFSRRGNALSGTESTKAYSIAKKYAEMALELDGDLAEAHTSMGRIKRSADWDWDGAERSFRKAIELDPNNAIAHSWLAQLLSSVGRHDEALAYIDRATELDPVSPTVNGVRFPVLEGRRDFDLGLKLAEEALRHDKENQNSKRSYATFLLHKGKFEEVIEYAEPLIGETENSQHVWLSLLAGAYFRSGRTDLAAPIVEKIRARAESDSKFRYSLAVVFAELGRRDAALDELESCFKDHEERLVWIKTEPRLDSLRGEARFLELERKMKLN